MAGDHERDELVAHLPFAQATPGIGRAQEQGEDVAVVVVQTRVPPPAHDLCTGCVDQPDRIPQAALRRRRQPAGQHGGQRAAGPLHHHLQGGVHGLDDALAVRGEVGGEQRAADDVDHGGERGAVDVQGGGGSRVPALPQRPPGGRGLLRDGVQVAVVERGLGDAAAPAPDVAVRGQQTLPGHQGERAVLNGALTVAAVVVLEHPPGTVGGVHQQHGRSGQGKGDEVAVAPDGALEEGERVAPDAGHRAEHLGRERPVDRQRGVAGVAAGLLRGQRRGGHR